MKENAHYDFSPGWDTTSILDESHCPLHWVRRTIKNINKDCPCSCPLVQ